jgi:AraC family transcriptional regulator
MLIVTENLYSDQRQPRHAHAETTVTLVLAGQLRERVGSREEIARPLSIVLKPRDTEHANEFGDGVRTLQIMLPEDAAAALEAADSGFRAWRWHHAGPAVPAFLRLLRARRSAGFDATGVDRVQTAAYDALAALRLEPVDSRHGAPPRWLAVVAEQLDDAPRAVRELARDAGVHPVHLARQFRRWFGHSITEHLARRRVQRAAALIAGADWSLSTVSHEAAFTDQPHMCRIFARETGLTPGAYRALAGGMLHPFKR